MPTKEITLNPGEDGRVSFSFIPTEVRVHAVNINGLTGSFEALAVIVPPELSLELELEPALIYRGTEVIIRAIVSNIGAVAAHYFVDFYINDELILTLGAAWGPEGRAIAPGSSHNNICKFIVPEIGHYDVRVSVHNTDYAPLEATTGFDAIEAPPGVPNMDILDCRYDVAARQAYVWVRNIGDGGGDISCDWYIDDSFVKSQSTYLAPGVSLYTFWTDIPIECGTHEVRAEFAWDGHTAIRHCSYTIEAPELVQLTWAGHITDSITHYSVPGALVRMDGYTTYASDRGYFELRGPMVNPLTLPPTGSPSSYIGTISKDGYKIWEQALRFYDGTAAPNYIYLEPL